VESIACESYLIVRPGGNVLVDTPRFNPVLAKRLQELGGVEYIFLTHKASVESKAAAWLRASDDCTISSRSRAHTTAAACLQDDVGEHTRWAEFFGAPRILHADEVVAGTQDVEIKLTGSGPWRLPDGGEDVELIFTPGHTSAHVVCFYAPDKAIFTGDHLSGGYRPGEVAYVEGQDLYVYTRYNWCVAAQGGGWALLVVSRARRDSARRHRDRLHTYPHLPCTRPLPGLLRPPASHTPRRHSIPQQLESVKKLLDYDWLHVCPGHGRPAHMRDAAHRLQAVSSLLQYHGYKEGAAAAAAASS
jgi:glyoxylase-like metal-dependent hydrolase (beta-lactamase superfamily II)